MERGINLVSLGGPNGSVLKLKNYISGNKLDALQQECKIISCLEM